MRTPGHPPIGDLLLGRTRGKLLGILCGSPDRQFYLREIGRQTGISVGTLQRELKLLTDVGLLHRSVSGKQVHYQANREHPLFPEISALAAKMFGIFELLRAALQTLVPAIDLAFVYGSVARNEQSAQSDVDLAIIGDVTLDDVIEALTSVEQRIGRPVNPTIYSHREFRSKLQNGNHFVNSLIRSEKVILIGDERELRQMGRVRLAPRGANKPSGNRGPVRDRLPRAAGRGRRADL